MRTLITVLTLLFSNVSLAGQETDLGSMVYLVSAPDVKKGSRVFVEPLFLTDGRKFHSLVEYCELTSSASNKVSENERKFCENKNLIVSGSKLLVIDNFGRILRISDVSFVGSTPSRREDGPVGPYDQNIGTATVHEIVGASSYAPLRKLDEAESKDFFLASNDANLLKRITPVSRPTDADVSRAIAKATAIVEQKKGIQSFREYSKSNLGKEKVSLQESGLQRGGGSVSWGPVLMGDVDADGRIDTVVGAIVFYPSDGGMDKDANIWSAAIGLVGKNDSQLHSVYHPYLSRQSDWKQGRFDFMPLLLVRMDKCTYVLNLAPYWANVRLVSYSLNTESTCPDTGVENIVNTDRLDMRDLR